ncbi:Exodeoxyribonuclease I [Bertholletia excelsa]
MEISFEDDGASKCLDDDDDQLFASLVAGDPAMVSSADDSPSKKHPCGSDSSVDWEEGITGYNAEKDDGLAPANEKESRLPLAEGGSNDDDEVEWEDGDSVVFKDTNSVPAETSKTSLKGDWKEEADLQEAIKRSLEDFRGQRSNDASFADNKLNNAREVDCETASIGSFLHGNSKVKPYVPYGDVLQAEKFSNNITSEVEKMDSEDKMDTVNTDDCPTGQLAQSIEFNFDSREEAINKPQERNPNSCDGLFRHDTNEVGNLLGDIGCKKTGMHLVMEQALGMHNTACQVSTHADSSSIVSSKISNIVSSEIFDSSSNTTPDVVLSDAQQNVTEVAQATGVAEPGDSSVKESTTLRTVLEAAKGKMEPVQSSFRELTSEQEVVKKDRTYDHIVHSGGDEVEGIALKDGKDHPVEVTEASLEEEMLNLTKECIDLGVEQRRLERNAESVSSEMFAECQELLQMFGLPYIIAPMEAEAQCAYMELAKLVDGVVTDDSDAFLFGARSVYKNIFDDRKYVETYFMKDIENELGLTREKLIHMALLLGSDYTEGVSGIGIVNAIEVVNAFSEEDGLRKFREWIESPDPTILGTLDVHIGSRRRGSKGGSGSNKEDLSAPGQTDAPSMHCIDEKKQIFMDKHRNVSKNWHIPSSFPSEAVISAYAAPQVDNSTEPFSWGKPDRLVLRKLCWEKFGWSAQKADELLLPVLKEYNKHETQLRLEAFYTFNERFAKIRSKRIKKAVRGITGNASSELIDEFGQEASKGRKKRRIGASERGEDKLEKSASEMEDCDVIDGGKSTQRSIAMQSRNEKHVETRPAEGEDPKQVTNQGSIVRGDQPGGRGRWKRHHGLGVENSNEDGDSSDYEEEIQFEKLGGCQRGVRKSTRTRKAVKYTFDDSEASEPSNPAEDGDNCNHEEAVQKEASKDCGWFGNAAGNVGDKNQDQVGGLSFETCSAMDEAEPDLETGQLNLHRNVDLSSEAESTKEYLMTGGGFCLNEDGINDTDKCASDTDEASVPDDANAPSSDVITEADPETGSVQHIYSPVRDLDGFKDSSKTDVLDSRQNLDWSTSVTSDDPSGSAISPGTGVKTGDSGAAAVNSLSAMPNLRRKKRRKH